MTDDLGQFRVRQDRFDARLTTLEDKVRIQADMRAAMDSDLSDIKLEQRAQRGMLQALGTTQSEHGTDIRVIKADVADIKDRLTGVEGRLTGVEGRLGTVESTLGNVQIGVQTIIAMLDRHIEDHGPGAE